MFNPMNMIGNQIAGSIQQNFVGNPMTMLMQMKQRGMSPQQAYEELMKNPQFVQSVNVARQQYPNMSFVEIAKQHGYDIHNVFGNL